MRHRRSHSGGKWDFVSAIAAAPVGSRRDLSNQTQPDLDLMLSPSSNVQEAVAGTLTKLALELNFVESETDSGLLPVNCLLGELAELLQNGATPRELGQAVRMARAWLDQILDTTARWNVATIQRLTEWHQWMNSSANAWIGGRPCPAPLAAWGEHPENKLGTAPSNASSGSPGNTVPSPASEPSMLLSLEADEELLREFINESQEHLQNIENGVLVLEEDPSDSDTLNSIFRAFHTFKGGSGFLNLIPIKSLAHELESLLDAARQHKLVIDSTIIDLILQGGDTLKVFVGKIGEQLNGTNPGAPIVVPTLALIARVQAALDGNADGTKAKAPSPAPVPAKAPTSIPNSAAQAASIPPLAPTPTAASVELDDSATETGRQSGPQCSARLGSWTPGWGRRLPRHRHFDCRDRPDR